MSNNPETPGIMSDFELVLSELANMHAQKQKDYGTDADPYANVRGSTDWGIAPWIGAMVRATDKIKRLQKYARDGQLANESAEDSFIDFVVYGIIGLILWREDKADSRKVADELEAEAYSGEIKGQDCSARECPFPFAPHTDECKEDAYGWDDRESKYYPGITTYGPDKEGNWNKEEWQ